MIYPTLKNKDYPNYQDFINYLDTYRNHLIYYDHNLNIKPDEFHTERPFKNRKMSHGYIYSNAYKRIKFIWSESNFIDNENDEIINSVINDLKIYHPKIQAYACYEEDNSPTLNILNKIIYFPLKDEIFEFEYSLEEYRYNVDGKVVDKETYLAREFRASKRLDI